MACGLFLCLAVAMVQATDEDRGAEIILIKNDRANDVHFPHHRHQSALEDCRICHNLFPKESGSIKKLIGQGKLRQKQIMTKHCIDCHRKMKREGRKTGPTSCARCHYKWHLVSSGLWVSGIARAMAWHAVVNGLEFESPGSQWFEWNSLNPGWIKAIPH